MRIAVILGGRSSENPISIASAQSVVRALESAGDEVLAIEVGRDGRWQLGSAGRPELPARLPGKEVATTLSADATEIGFSLDRPPRITAMRRLTAWGWSWSCPGRPGSAGTGRRG